MHGGGGAVEGRGEDGGDGGNERVAEQRGGGARDGAGLKGEPARHPGKRLILIERGVGGGDGGEIAHGGETGAAGGEQDQQGEPCCGEQRAPEDAALPTE